MNFTDTKAALEALSAVEAKIAAFQHAIGVIELDAETVAPKNTTEGRSKTMGILSGYLYEVIAAPENRELLSYLEAHTDELSHEECRRTAILRKSCDQLSRIPQNEYVDYTVLISNAQAVWEKAKNENDFPAFAPYLEKIVEFNRKFAGYYNPNLPAYDALLNEYEEGLTMETLDIFFGKLRAAIVPLIEKIATIEPMDDSFLHYSYPIDIQRKYSEYLMEVLGIDRGYCGIAESEHPFTTNFNNKDVRITTHYYEHNLASSMYSVIHEAGHAIYELGCDDKYSYTTLAGGVSMSIHESQSRFFENIIGRSFAFVNLVFPKLRELFPIQLSEVDASFFCRAVNKAEPSLIRTEADELTYSLHVMVRYEIEKKLIAGELAVCDVPKEWNRLYKEYLGVDVPSDTMGCLQDSHWSGGSFGYFPSYALGSAYGAQMLAKMEEELGDIQALIMGGKLSEVKAWLGEHIHRHASLYNPGELLEMTCGKFDAQYYIDYLTKKFTALYGIY